MFLPQTFSCCPLGAPLARCLLLGALALSAGAATLSDNLNQPTDFTEVISGSNWITAGFGTASSTSVLSSATLLLSNLDGTPTLDLYSNSSGQPGAWLGGLIAPTSVSSGTSEVVFGGAGLRLAPETSYWLVAKADTGQFEWAFTDSNTGSGIGFEGTWGSSGDFGATWFTSDLEPMQMRVLANSVTPIPEPGTLAMQSLALLIIPLALFRESTKRTRE